MLSADLKVCAETFSPNSCFDQNECGYTMPEVTDCKSHCNSSLPFLNAETDQTNCMRDGKQAEKCCDIVLKKPSEAEEHENVPLELNKEVCFPSKSGNSSGNDHETDSTEKSISVTVLPPSSMQTVHPACNNQLETESSLQVTRRTSSSTGDNFFNASLNAATGSQVTGHHDNRCTGARPKRIASRKLKNAGRSKHKHTSVTWSEENKCVTFIDDVTYDHYRNCILNLPFPNNRRPSAAAEAVLFMCEKDEQISLSLIDIAMKFLWVKLGFCPKAALLYTTITELNYDERSFVSAFLELYQTEPCRTRANTLFGNIQTSVSGPAYRNQASQGNTDETDMFSQMFTSTTDQKSLSNSLTDNKVKSEINSGQQTVQVLNDEPLKALDFHIPQSVSHFPGNLQLPCETNHPVAHVDHSFSHIDHPVSHIDHPVSHSNHPVSHTNHSVSHINHPVSHTNHPVSHTNHPVSHINYPVSHTNHPVSHINHPVSYTDHPVSHINHPVSHINHPVSHIDHPVSHTNHPVSHINHPVSQTNHPVSHIHHTDSITNSETSRKQQRSCLSPEQMRHLQIKALKKEQEYLKKTLTCVLCKNKPAEITLLPCGHFVLCAACSKDCYICPVCNKEALAEVKTFIC